MALSQKFNNENILMRAVIAGLLDVLNNNVKFSQIWGDEPEDKEEIIVPFYYNQSGDERFMQDFYTHYAECLPPRPVDGNFDMVPRGVISYTGSTIDQTRITSRYVQGNYVKEEDGKLEGYVSYLYSLPLTTNIDVDLWIDTFTNALKIEQELREYLYKVITYYVYYKGMKIGCTAGFPEGNTIQKNIAYSFESDNRIKLTFQIAVETYQPVFDPTTEQKASSAIKKLTYNLYSGEEKYPGIIKPITPKDNSIIPKSIPLFIEWKYSGEGAIMRDVDIVWKYKDSTDFTEIAIATTNHEYFVWNIPKDFTNYKEPNIIWQERNDIIVTRYPFVSILPDLSTGLITNDSFKIIDRGYFNSNIDNTYIYLQLEMTDKDNKIEYTKDNILRGVIRNNVLDSIELVNTEEIKYPGELDSKEIDLFILNSGMNETYESIKNLKII